MGKNQIGGKKHKRSKNVTQPCNMTRKLILADPESEKYGYVIAAMGDCRMKCYCEDKVERIGIIRGNMRKRTFVSIGDIVIMSMRSFQDNKADITNVYNSDEVMNLLQYGEIKNINVYKTTNDRETRDDDSVCSEDNCIELRNERGSANNLEPSKEFVNKVNFDFDSI